MLEHSKKDIVWTGELWFWLHVRRPEAYEVQVQRKGFLPLLTHYGWCSCGAKKETLCSPQGCQLSSRHPHQQWQDVLRIWATENIACARLVDEPNHSNANNSGPLPSPHCEPGLLRAVCVRYPSNPHCRQRWSCCGDCFMRKKWGLDRLNDLSVITWMESGRAGFYTVAQDPYYLAFPPLKTSLCAGHFSPPGCGSELPTLSPTRVSSPCRWCHTSFLWPHQVRIHSLNTSCTSKILCFCSLLVP